MQGLGRLTPALLSLVLFPAGAAAHGLWGHVHVTGWAIENLPEGELRDFFADPAVRAAALFGAAFPDTGYARDDAASQAYGEHSHWEPFIQDFISAVAAESPPPFEDLETRQLVAFLMGCAAHGLQDEIFDSLFLYQVQEHDGADQAEADPASDGFLTQDGYIRFIPEADFLPLDALLPLYADLPETVTADTIERSVDLVMVAYLNDRIGLGIAESLGEQWRPELPWMAAHYLDHDVPGSLRSEIRPTAAYMQAIWDRLHGRLDAEATVIHAYPVAPRRLLGSAAGSPDSWATVVTGLGMANGSAAGRWLDADGEAVPFELRATRWTGAGWSRLLRFQPSSDLEPGAWYTVHLDEAALVDGSGAGEWSFTFQAPCSAANAEQCPDLGPLEEPSIDPPADPSPEEDDGEPVEDGEPANGGDMDAEAGDEPDASGDAADVDAEDDQAVAPDPAADAEEPLAEGTEDEGCGCRAAATSGATPALAVALLLLGLGRGRTRTERPWRNGPSD